MKFKKLIVAAGAVAMLGSLVTALPASAATIERTVELVPDNLAWYAWECTANDGSLTVGDTTKKSQDRNNAMQGDMFTLSVSDKGIVQARSNAIDIMLQQGVEYTISVDYDINISSVNESATNGTMGAYVQIGSTNNQLVQGLNVGDTNVSKSGKFEKKYTPESKISLQDAVKLYLRRVAGTVTYSNLSVSYTEEVEVGEPTEITIENNYDTSKVLFNGDSFDMKAVVKNAAGDVLNEAVVWTVQRTKSDTDKTLIDAKATGYKIEDGKFTLTNTGRDTPGKDKKWYITASVGELRSEILEVKVDRLRTSTYKINAGEGVTVDDVAKVDYKLTVNNEEKDGQINDYKAGASGYSDFKAVITVPEGFELTLTDRLNTNYTDVITDGNTITVIRDSSKATNKIVDNDFYIEGTLTKKVIVPTGTLKFLETFTGEQYAGTASAYSFVVNPGTVKGNLTVKIGDVARESVTELNGGAVTFGIVAETVEGISATVGTTAVVID